MELEWDEVKRQWNKDNRGLDFADVQQFDQDPVVTIADKRRDYGEVRYNSFGYLRGEFCTYCFTWRENRMRIISLRRANDREFQNYQVLKGAWDA